jgi:two-component system, NtrC family, response regulator HydG
MKHDFPGNVRELENLVEQAAALSETEELTPIDFPLRTRGARPEGTPVAGRSTPTAEMPISHGTLADAVNDAERRAITAALEKSPDDLAHVAEQLGISATTLWRKMKRLELKTSVPEPS